MPITLTTPWNKSYCRLNGTFSGTVETHFQVTIEDQDGTTFKWRKKTGPTFTWSSYTTGVSTSLNTNISLSDGMSVMFTRSSLTIYATGDSWKFQVLPDLLLEVPSGSTYTTGTIEEPYDNLETLELSITKMLKTKKCINNDQIDSQRNFFYFHDNLTYASRLENACKEILDI